MPSGERHETGQDDATISRNTNFFRGNDQYVRHVQRLETYKNLNRAITEQVAGCGHLLDIGNGGTFDYDTNTVGRITAVDLFLADLPPESFPANVTPDSGDALDLHYPDGHFDGVLMCMLIHHLIGRTYSETMANLGTAIREAVRVLRPGGKLVIADSFVPGWFFDLERRFFPLLHLAPRFLRTTHPAAFQHTVRGTRWLLSQMLQDVQVRRVPTGALILQYGVPFPVALTPTRPGIIAGRKAEGRPADAPGALP